MSCRYLIGAAQLASIEEHRTVSYVCPSVGHELSFLSLLYTRASHTNPESASTVTLGHVDY